MLACGPEPGSPGTSMEGNPMATAATTPHSAAAPRPMPREERKVILASSLGTVVEWYDFYLYGSLATIIGAQFFSAFDVTTRNVFALLAFAAGFLVRPFGAIFFGRIGDLVGRKYTFLVTILIMGFSTFLVGLLPSYNQIGWIAPVILIALRMLQGLALGGEYGGAAVYVAEHAPVGRRGFYTSWIQTTATLGLLLSLFVIVALRISMGENAFQRDYELFLGLKARLAPSVPRIDPAPRHLGLHPAADAGIARLPEDEGRGHAVQGAA